MPGDVAPPFVKGVSESLCVSLHDSSTSLRRDERKDGAGAAAAAAGAGTVVRGGERRGVDVWDAARPFVAAASVLCSELDPAFSCGLFLLVRGRLSLRSGCSGCPCGSLGDSVAFLFLLGDVPPGICSCLALSYAAQALRSASDSCGGAGAWYAGAGLDLRLIANWRPAP